EFPRLSRNLNVDVAIVGGGMTGISTAYLLKKAGLKVALLERNRIGTGETGNTTAHLTYVTDPRLTRLVQTFGQEKAQSVWEAARHALGEIERIVRKQHIDCDFARIPGFLHLPRAADIDPDLKQKLKTEATLARELGFDASFVDSAPLVH